MRARRFGLIFVLALLPTIACPPGGSPEAQAPAQPAPRWTAQVAGAVVDLTPTMQRIASGGTNPHRNDGTRFQNREQHLPQEHSYTEYVVPTAGTSGPGPKRIVIDESGRAYYTPDHYDHFYPVAKR